jgi:tRNA nucleotidyltransferase (CCA-adding enzyme)
MVGRIVSSERVRRGAVKLSVHHLKPHDFHVNNASPRAFKRLALKLAPETSLERLAALALADFRGRNSHGDEPLEVESPRAAWFLRQAMELKVNREPEPPVLKGRHLLDCMKPGPDMGRLLRRAYEIQLEEGVEDPAELKQRVLSEDGDSP